MPDIIYISAKSHRNINELKKQLVKLFDLRTVSATDTIVTNARHAQSLHATPPRLKKVMKGLKQFNSGDLFAR